MTLDEKAKEFVRYGECEVFDSYIAHEDTYKAGYRRAIADAVEIAEGDCGMHMDWWDAKSQTTSRVIAKRIKKLTEPNSPNAVQTKESTE